MRLSIMAVPLGTAFDCGEFHYLNIRNIADSARSFDKLHKYSRQETCSPIEIGIVFDASSMSACSSSLKPVATTWGFCSLRRRGCSRIRRYAKKINDTIDLVHFQAVLIYGILKDFQKILVHAAARYRLFFFLGNYRRFCP